MNAVGARFSGVSGSCGEYSVQPLVAPSERVAYVALQEHASHKVGGGGGGGFDALLYTRKDT